MVRGKVPGAHGVPVEFFATYKNELAPRLAQIYSTSQKTGHLLESTCEALVIPLETWMSFNGCKIL